jgi:predicted outer membrane lipoprotein
MNRNEQSVSVAEAKSTLKSLAIIEKDTTISLRAPLWLNLIISCSYGMGVFSWATTRHDNQWMLGVIISAVVFVLGIGFYLYSSRLLGVKPKLAPKSKSEFIFGLLLAIFFGVVVVLTRELSKDDIWWASYAGAVITALALAYFMYRFPSGDYKTGTNQND